MLKKGSILILIVLLSSTLSTYAQQTTIWLVRHAEKQTAEGAMSSTDPDLTADGDKRAHDLATVLKNEEIDAVYSTAYKRTMSTGSAVAVARQLKIITYTPKDFKALADNILQNLKGKEILIVGHSNTIIPMAKALGAAVPFEDLAENDYDMLFKVLIGKDGAAKLTISHYGIPHHSTEIPLAFKP